MRHTESIMRNIGLCIGVAFLCALSGCTKKANEERAQSSIILGFSQIGAESAWRTFNTKSMRLAAERSGIRLLYENAEQKQENQIKAIRSFIVYQVDVIVFVPIVQDGWDNVLREAKDAGIPVIVYDRKLTVSNEDLYAGYIGTDSVEEGRDAARFLLGKFKTRAARSISSKYAVPTGHPHRTAAQAAFGKCSGTMTAFRSYTAKAETLSGRGEKRSQRRF